MNEYYSVVVVTSAEEVVFYPLCVFLSATGAYARGRGHGVLASQWMHDSPQLTML